MMLAGILMPFVLVAAAAKGQDTFHWKWYWSAALCVVPSVLVGLFPVAIANMSGANVPVNMHEIWVAIPQYFAACAVYWLLDRQEDAIFAWIATVIGGALVIFMLIPPLFAWLP